MNHQIVVWLVSHTQSSVLGGPLDLSAQRSVEFKAALLTAPLSWATYLAMIYLYTIALVMTAGLVRQANDGCQPEIASQIGSVRDRRRDAFLFASKVFGLMIIGMLATGVLIVRSALVIGERLSVSTTGLVAALVVYMAISFLVTPAALRLIAGNSGTVSRQGARDGRWFAAIFTSASVTLGYFCAIALNSTGTLRYGNQPIVRFLADAVCSAITALPYIPLFVCLSLIALDTAESSQEVAQ